MISSSKRAFTLVEVITSVALMTAVMVVVSIFQFNVLTFNRSSAVALNNTQEAMSIMRTVAKELRSMEPGGNGVYPIQSAASSSITFFTDVGGNGTKEKIRYYILGNTFYRGITQPVGTPPTYNPADETTKVLTTGVRNTSSIPVFQYYSSTYTGTSSAMTYPLNISAIRLVNVSLSVDSDPNKSPIIRTFSTQIQLRNLKDNL